MQPPGGGPPGLGWSRSSPGCGDGDGDGDKDPVTAGVIWDRGALGGCKPHKKLQAPQKAATPPRWPQNPKNGLKTPKRLRNPKTVAKPPNAGNPPYLVPLILG